MSVISNKIFYFLSILLLVLTALLLYHYLMGQSAVKPGVREAAGLFSKPFHDFTRFHYVRNENARRVFSIKADRVRIQKKKIGLIRFGLIKEAIVDNAIIEVYKPDGQMLDLKILSDTGIIDEVVPESKSKLVVFKPITFRVMTEKNQLLTTITAGSARLDPKNRKIVFDQGVEISSEDRTLHAGSLALVSNDGRAIARQGVVLKTAEGTITSDVLQTNIFLTISAVDEKGTL